ncbi:STM4011 family radical SAM protein [Lacipirellula parvula]|uniref:Putative inner membrane protein n=1 Tax=Lacipirellula parvula TaxID=2650471 RepID=A0A5K7XJ02_9BACT|nr:STM4011 family radical SAM protein [Lacipirellula parvula]BBO34346.1 putative inner membrane protein [Lacipirellula parvula]
MTYSLLYRGFLSSCNYSCGYCPFAKRIESRARLHRDRQSVERFANWIAEQTSDQWKILFTPWGEALTRSWYRTALTRLSHLPQVQRVSAQTNLSCGVRWINDCNLERLSLWTTFHPSEVSAVAFAAKVIELRGQGVQLSVGMVAIPGALSDVDAMRDRLPPDVNMWLNAQQPRRRPFTEDEVARFSRIDPYFPLTLRPERSLGRPCPTGEVSFTVDGDGDMRRCHFVDSVIGNIYTPNWRASLMPRVCPNASCKCFLGTSQLLSTNSASALSNRLALLEH